jgi:hypothetical protein
MASSTVKVVSGIRLASDLQIEEWVQERYGFVPHPFWIDHCKELYIQGSRSSVERRPPRHECPADKRTAIREAFLHFGMLFEQTRPTLHPPEIRSQTDAGLHRGDLLPQNLGIENTKRVMNRRDMLVNVSKRADLVLTTRFIER